MNELVHYLVLQTQLLRKAIANSSDAFRKRLVCRYEHHFQFLWLFGEVAEWFCVTAIRTRQARHGSRIIDVHSEIEDLLV